MDDDLAGADDEVTCSRLTGEPRRLTVLQCARYWGAANGLATGGSALVRDRSAGCPQGRARVAELALPVSELSANSEAQKRAWKVRKQGRRSA